MYPRLVAAPLFALFLGLGLFGSALSPGGHAPFGTVASAATPEQVILSPRPRQVLRSNTVLLRVRSSDHSGALTARLNGVRIEQGFGRARKGGRTMRVSLSHGLRRGRNLLRIRVLRHGKSARRATVRFFLRRRQALVGAGKDRRVVVGSPVMLGGKVRNAGRAAGKSAVRWKVIKSPKAKKPALLTAPRKAGSGFRANRLGTYVLELRHRKGKVATSDRVKLDVVPENPMVPIETIPNVSQGPWGVQVGDQFYPVKDSRSYIQVLVLKRKTLQFVSNSSFRSSDDVKQMLAGLDDTKLVIVTRSSGVATGFDGFHDALTGIGGPNFDTTSWNVYYIAPHEGEFSMVGVPGMKTGTGDFRVAMQDGRDPHKSGDMRGYLIPDQYLNYGYVAADEHPISFGGAETEPDNESVGYRLGVLDAHTLLPLEGNGQFFDTNGGFSAPGEQEAEAVKMIKTLDAIGNDTVVTIQAVSDKLPGDANYQPLIGEVTKETMARLAAAVERVGGSANAFNRAATVAGVPASGGAVYSLIGWGGAGHGKGAEVAAGVNHASDVPVISTVLRPNNESKFRPTETVETAGGTAALSEIAMKPPTKAWPLDNNPGASRALSYLGSQDESLGPDPRSAYWTQDLDTDALIRTISAVTYPSGKNFTEDEFKEAKAELVKELGWVGKVRHYLNQLATPFASNALPSWEASKAIADRIYDEAHASDSKISFNWLEFTEALIGLIPIAGQEAESGLETLATLFEFGMRTYGAVDQGGEATDRDVEIESTKLGAELLTESQRMQASIQSMGDVIVSDYAKLSELGPHAGCNASDPDCPKQFAFSQADRTAASADVYRGIERVAYQKLLPLGYDIYALRKVNSTVEPDPRAYTCTQFPHPWGEYPNPAQNAARMLTELDPVGGRNSWVMYTIAKPRDGAPVMPGDDLFNRMFGPVSQGDPKEGGLAMSFDQLIPEHPAYFWGARDIEEVYCNEEM